MGAIAKRIITVTDTHNGRKANETSRNDKEQQSTTATATGTGTAPQKEGGAPLTPISV